ncbi:MAG TPA: LamG-like jellyroll fold domain-containing protein [Candidatus Limnocylindrales bacterium]
MFGQSVATAAAAAPAPPAAAPAPARATADPEPCSGEAATEAAATAMAVRCGIAVEALDQRTETAQVFAQPDGTLNARLHSGPERFQDGSGWHDVDLKLESKPDGSVVPHAHPRGLALSGSNISIGVADLASMRTGAAGNAQRVGLTWTGSLPVPVLDGNKATYVDALPGIDLEVTVSPSGFEQFVIVKSAAALPRLADVRLGLDAADLNPVAESTGGFRLVDDLGQTVLAAPTPRMWDAAKDSESGMPAQVSSVNVEVLAPPSAGESHPLKLSPDPAWLSAPARLFPITIDPGLFSDNDTYVRRNEPNSSFFGSSELLLGTSNGGGNTARSYLRWYYDAIYGARIFSGTLRIWEHHAYSCRAAEWQLWSAGYIGPSTTWNNAPGPLTHYHSSSETRGHPNCSSDYWVSIGATNFLQDIANAQYPYITMLLKAANEGHNDGWKRFNSADAGSNRPFLEINYTRPPTTNNVKVAGDCVSSCNSPTTVRVLTPRLQATVADPEGTALTVNFELWNAARTALVASTQFSGVASGSTPTWTTPALANNTQYHLRVLSKDSPGADSGWSGWSTFTTNTAGPSTPSNVAAAGDCYNSCASPAMLRNARPIFSASVAHPFNDTLTVDFEVWNAGKTAIVTSGSKTSVAPGTSTTWQPAANLAQNQQMHLRVKSTDSYTRVSSWSVWYTFTTDITAPVLPVVSSTLYPEKTTGTYHGGVGIPAVFSLSPNGSADVVQYQWKLNGGSVTLVSVAAGAAANVTITPATDLEQLLQVQTVDTAGWTSGWKDYRFLVRSQAVDAAYWKLDGNTASATGGSSYTGVLSGGPAFEDSVINPANPAGSGKGLRLDGTDDYMSGPTTISTDHPAGFSVSAWVKPSVLTGYRTVVAQQGRNTYAFRLYYRPESNQWCFGLRPADDTASGTLIACSSLTPQTGVWTHLTGVYDPVAAKIRLYVNGGPANGFVPGTVSETSAPAVMWRASGSWQVGRTDGGTYFGGVVDEVRAYQRMLPEVEARHLFIACWSGSCPQVPVAADPVKECVNKTAPMCVGEWRFDEGTGATAADTSEQENTATLSGSAAWTSAGYNTSTGITLDGTTGYATTARPAVLTEQSYSLSVWVKPDALTHDMRIMNQAGTDASALVLSYTHGDGRWRFSTTSHDGTTFTWHVASANVAAKAGVWTHLVAVYDSNARQLRLYVNGLLSATKSNAASRPTAPGQTTFIGGVSFGDVFDGTLDLVRTYQGALSDTQVAQLFVEQLAPPKLVTWWELEEFGSPTVDDLSPRNNDGTLSATGATWTEDGNQGTAVTLDGVSGSIQTAGPAIVTTDSFSVSTWVRLSRTPAGTWTVLAQDGTTVSGFYLGVRQKTTGGPYHWTFQMHTTDAAGPTARTDSINPIAAADVGAWVHLIGVYDAVRGEIRLYVNGVPQLTVPRATTPWQATGPLTVGRARYNGGPVDFFPGTVDAVRAYQGALTDAQALKVFQGLDI